MPFEKGNNLGKGRPEGRPNKLTRQVKDVINKLLECMTDEDVRLLYDDLKTNKPEVLISFIGRIAPKDLNVKTEVKTSDLSESIQELIKKDSTNISK